MGLTESHISVEIMHPIFLGFKFLLESHEEKCNQRPEVFLVYLQTTYIIPLSIASNPGYQS